MTLEVLKNVEEIGGFKVLDMEKVRQERPELFREDGSMHYQIFEKEYRPNYFIQVRQKSTGVESISFTMQKDGAVKEVGVTGAQVDTIIEAAKVILEGLNEQYPCRENACAITKLDEALLWLMKRKQERIKRGVEGFNKL